MPGRLALRYWFVVAGLLTAFLVVGGAVEIVAAFRENVSRLAAVQRAEALLVAGRIDQVLRTIEQSLEDTASLPWREGLLGLEDVRQEFHRVLKVVPAIYEIRAYGAGDALALQVSRVKPDVITAAHGQRVAEQPVPPRRYGDIQYRNGSEPFTTLTLPVTVPSGLFRRIEADLNLKFASEVIGKAAEGSPRRAYVIDRAGNLVAHSDRTLPLRRLNLGGLQHVNALVSAGESAYGGVSGLRSNDLAGAEIVASGVAMRTAPWLTFAEEPLQHAMRDAWSTVWRTTLLVAAGLLAAVLASFLLARRLSRPIVEVRRGAQRIARGDFAARIDVKTGDEVEALADDFNRMAGQLQEYTTGLERKVQEKTAQLQDALKVANDAMRARAVFLAAASHDLRQPLHAISLFAGALRAESLPDGAAETVKNMRRAIDSLRLLFDNLLDLSRFDAREIRPVLRHVSLRDVLGSVASAFEMDCAAKGLRWKCQVADVWVRTDPELLRRLVRNLLSNAVRYTPNGEVQLIAVADESRALVQVVDTGIGIAPEDQARVFEEFVQLDNPARDRERGVGLGLSIVKRIAELIDADLRIDSRVGGGTTVSFGLPVVPADAAHAQADAAPVDEHADFSGLRVWAVEDDLDVRTALATMLEGWHVSHSIVSSRRELIALREASAAPPDAVILDDMIGAGDSGLEIAQWVRSFVPEERIVLVTGNVDEERTRALEASGLVVLRKPLAPSDLSQWLRDATAAAKAL